MVFNMLLNIALMLPLFSLAGFPNPDDLSNVDGRNILCSILTSLEKNNGNGIWPGYNPLETPLIIRFRDQIFGYGKSNAFKEWTKEKTEKCIYYSAPHTFKIPTSPIVPYLDFNGAQAFYFDTTIKEKLSVWVLSTIIHERFHRYQWENFANTLLFTNSKYLAHVDNDNVRNSLIENHRLSSYLQLNDESAWIDFLSVAFIRDMNLSQESRSWELDQQISEGTAVYVQLKSFELIEKEFGIQFRNIWTQKMVANLNDSQGIDGIIKWRHYAIGSMLCDFLDRHISDETWKVSLQTQAGQSMFRNAAILTGAAESNLKDRGREISESPEGKGLHAQATKLIFEYLEEVKEIKNKLDTFNFQIELKNISNNCSGGGISKRTFYLPDGGTMGLNYSGSQNCGAENQATFVNIPIIFNSKNSTFFGLDSLKVWVNLAEIQINEGQYRFQKLKIESDSFSLDTSISGKISIYNSQIQIIFDR